MSETVLEPISNNKETVSDGSETFFSRDVGIAEAAKLQAGVKGK